MHSVEMYTVELGGSYIKDSPKWFQNMFYSTNHFDTVHEELGKFNGVYKVIYRPCVLFNSEQDYLLCVLRWS